MSRRLRFNLPGVPQHIVQRGNNGQPAFLSDRDYGFYLECLKDAADKYGCDLHAYVLMTNHVHLLATPRSTVSISRMMQSIGRRYVQYVNYNYKRSGTLWEGRHKTNLVGDERYLVACYRYIELNPVRANMAKHPADYRWSSYPHHADGKPDALIRNHPQYLALGMTDQERQAAYRGLFRDQLDPALIHEMRAAIKQGSIVGSDRFKAEMEALLKRRLRPAKRGRPFKNIENLNTLNSHHSLQIKFNSDPI